MKIVKNKYLPGRNFLAINICGVLFTRYPKLITPQVINHERIHTYQMLELGVVGFYLIYVVEWLLWLIVCRDVMEAYRKISFEREAYAHANDMSYLSHRKHYAQWRS